MSAGEDSFKVDIRVSYHHHGKVFDVGNVEFAKSFREEKRLLDHNKLLLESKSALNKLSSIGILEANVLGLEIAGVKGQLMTTANVDDGLYFSDDAYDDRLRLSLSNANFIQTSLKALSQLSAFKTSGVAHSVLIQFLINQSVDKRLSFKIFLKKRDGNEDVKSGNNNKIFSRPLWTAAKDKR